MSALAAAMAARGRLMEAEEESAEAMLAAFPPGATITWDRGDGMLITGTVVQVDGTSVRVWRGDYRILVHVDEVAEVTP